MAGTAIDFAETSFSILFDGSDVSSAGPGLMNQGNSCFMNAAMQMVADFIKHHGISERAYTCSIPDALLQELKNNCPPSKSQLEISTPFYTLRSDIRSLCDALTAEDWNFTTVNNHMETFIKSYKEFAKATGRTSALDVIGNDHGCFSQQDAQEFLNVINDVLDLNSEDSSSLIVLSKFSLQREGTVLAQRYGKASNDRSALLCMEIPDKENVTLQDCTDLFLAKEPMDSDSRCEWEPQYLVTANLIDTPDKAPDSTEETNKLLQGTEDHKELVLAFAGEKPPRSIVVMPKLYDYNPVENRSERLDAEGKSLLEHLEDEVVIPCYRASLPTDKKSVEITDNTPVQQKYRTRSVVVHTLFAGGHYVTVRSNNGKYVICDDSSVNTLEDLGCSTLKEYFESKSACGYIFALQAVEQSTLTQQLQGTLKSTVTSAANQMIMFP
ncbi:hypothetical protein [Parendozoicomonas sp. Alg238-R29]|uniref:hypothetical protein n=1 Tax=Parendozoicomonas sp. Alg238-R29 TaxID=2993446 RepID=UPI00248D71FE|nr:hypothetical protein [Parendozoicomonas sp. Alg238-R29]